VNRGAVDLLGVNTGASESAFGLPRTRSLYGSLPEPLKDPDLFSMQLKRMLAARKKVHIDQAKLIAVPETNNSSVCILIMRVPDRTEIIVTALNFSREPVEEKIDQGVKELSALEFGGKEVFDCMAKKAEGAAGGDGKIMLSLSGWSGKTLAIDSEPKK
jgi:hypothetical protein